MQIELTWYDALLQPTFVRTFYTLRFFCMLHLLLKRACLKIFFSILSSYCTYVMVLITKEVIKAKKLSLNKQLSFHFTCFVIHSFFSSHLLSLFLSSWRKRKKAKCYLLIPQDNTPSRLRLCSTLLWWCKVWFKGRQRRNTHFPSRTLCFLYCCSLGYLLVLEKNMKSTKVLFHFMLQDAFGLHLKK